MGTEKYENTPILSKLSSRNLNLPMETSTTRIYRHGQDRFLMPPTAYCLNTFRRPPNRPARVSALPDTRRILNHHHSASPPLSSPPPPSQDNGHSKQQSMRSVWIPPKNTRPCVSVSRYIADGFGTPVTITITITTTTTITAAGERP